MHLSDGCIAYQPEKHKLEVLRFLCIHLTLLLYLDLMYCEFLYWSLTVKLWENIMNLNFNPRLKSQIRCSF
jgi:hypothetical protein